MMIYGGSLRDKVSSRDRELSGVLEELIKEELTVNLKNTVKESAGELKMEIDFEPFKVKASISELVREMKSEREILYLNSSVIVKRFIEENGSNHVRQLYIEAYNGLTKIAFRL